MVVVWFNGRNTSVGAAREPPLHQNIKMFTRKSIRLRNYNYSQPGAYFITICSHNRALLFGEVVDGVMVLNELGRIATQSWKGMEQHYDYISLDEWVVMPNHFHGILVINARRGGSRAAPTPKIKPLGQLVGAFKTISTKQINQLRHTPGAKVWQRNYYEHIIRNDTDLAQIREYIANNPLNWRLDTENPMANP